MLSSAVAIARTSNGAPALTVPEIDLVPDFAVDQPGLPGERRLVEDGIRARDNAIHRNHLTGLDEEVVANFDCCDRLLDDLTVLVAPNGLRRTREKGGQLSLGTAFGVALKPLARGQHQADHCGGKILLKEERATDRQDGDDVNASVSPDEISDDGQRQPDSDKGGRDGPRPHGEIVPAPELQGDAEEEPSARQGQQGSRPKRFRLAREKPSL